jgi:hypothetical protein
MATPAELLNRMHDIHGAPEPSWWPPAPGWWVLGAAVAAALLVYWWRSRRESWHAQALRELKRAEREFAETRDAARCVAQVSVLLRTVAVSRARGIVVAGLTGEDWLRYLDDALGGRHFSKGAGRVLLTAPYMPTAEIDAAALCELTRQWLRSVS